MNLYYLMDSYLFVYISFLAMYSIVVCSVSLFPVRAGRGF